MEAIEAVTVGQLIDRYSVLLLDSYGVLNRGPEALPGAPEVVAELNRLAKPYYVLTNDASSLPRTRAEMYRSVGLAIDPDRIITSGSLLPACFEAQSLRGTRCVVLGPEDSVRYVEAAGGRVVSHDDEFETIVIGDQSGYPFMEALDSVLSTLYRRLDGGEPVHLVLPNPDLVYPAGGGGWGLASASVAGLLETALKFRYPERPDLMFTRLGKPHAAIFEEALRRSGTRDMVMIGDQPETDIQGARAFGIDSVLVDGNGPPSNAATPPPHLRPTYRMDALALLP